MTAVEFLDEKKIYFNNDIKVNKKEDNKESLISKCMIEEFANRNLDEMAVSASLGNMQKLLIQLSRIIHLAAIGEDLLRGKKINMIWENKQTIILIKYAIKESVLMKDFTHKSKLQFSFTGREIEPETKKAMKQWEEVIDQIASLYAVTLGIPNENLQLKSNVFAAERLAIELQRKAVDALRKSYVSSAGRARRIEHH